MYYNARTDHSNMDVYDLVQATGRELAAGIEPSELGEPARIKGQPASQAGRQGLAAGKGKGRKDFLRQRSGTSQWIVAAEAGDCGWILLYRRDNLID
jgi:hypothetical protein